MDTKISLRPAIMALIFGGLALSIMLGLRQAMAILLSPVAQDTGWSIAGLGFGFALMNLTWGVAQPMAGALSDRYGPIPVMIGAVLIACSGLLLMNLADTLLWFNFGLGILVGASIAGCGFPVILGAILKRTPLERRSMFQGIGSSVGSFGMFAMVLIAQDLVEFGGWHFAVWMAMAVVSSIALMAFGLRTPTLAKLPSSETDYADLSLSEVLQCAGRERGFILLNLGFFVCGFHVAFIATHLPNFALGCGLTAEVGAMGLALIGLFNMIGSLVAGWVGGHFPHRLILSAIYGLRALVIAIFMMFPVTELSLYIFTATFGLLWLSTVPSTNSIVAILFGPKFVSTLFGVVFLSHQLGAFMGAWLSGLMYEANGNYDLVWWISIGLGVGASLIHLPIREEVSEQMSGAKTSGNQVIGA